MTDWYRSGEVRYHPDLERLMEPIGNVRQHPENYNNADLDAVVESIAVNGMYRPVYAQTSTGYIIAGNHTWEACASLGAEKIPVVWLDVDDIEALRIMVADNRIASLAKPDHTALVNLLSTITANSTTALLGTGVTAEDFTLLTKLAEIDAAEPLDFATWPTVCFTIHPRMRSAFLHLTREADNDPDRFELLLRLAGWDGN